MEREKFIQQCLENDLREQMLSKLNRSIREIDIVMTPRQNTNTNLTKAIDKLSIKDYIKK